MQVRLILYHVVQKVAVGHMLIDYLSNVSYILFKLYFIICILTCNIFLLSSQFTPCVITHQCVPCYCISTTFCFLLPLLLILLPRLTTIYLFKLPEKCLSLCTISLCMLNLDQNKTSNFIADSMLECNVGHSFVGYV